ncbi:MAG TPA: ABC transporter ATP-binding protein [Hyphomicrobiaceae bacterium]|nr:ABC transporter ATP-binding protein [Hyphomicrobiaceae bacterium]
MMLQENSRPKGPALEVSGLSLTIDTDEGAAQILDHADLVLEGGSIHGVVGESGCGKSTLLKAILGVLPARSRIDHGSIRLRRRELVGLSRETMQREVRGRQVGFIPQDPFQALNPVFRVETQLMEALVTHGVAGTETAGGATGSKAMNAHLLSLLKAVQLPDAEEALTRYPHQFSGGQRQRLLIAAALACAPSIVLADEPTTALDVTTQLQILKVLRELATTRSLSMLFVTHDFGVVAQLCDTVTVMYAGQTVETGPVREVLDAPKHPYTRMLLACHPERAKELAGIPGAVPSPLRPPPGCRFHPRCPQASEACRVRRPQPLRVGDDHAVACVLYGGESA